MTAQLSKQNHQQSFCTAPLSRAGLSAVWRSVQQTNVAGHQHRPWCLGRGVLTSCSQLAAASDILGRTSSHMSVVLGLTQGHRDCTAVTKHEGVYCCCGCATKLQGLLIRAGACVLKLLGRCMPTCSPASPTGASCVPLLQPKGCIDQSHLYYIASRHGGASGQAYLCLERCSLHWVAVE